MFNGSPIENAPPDNTAYNATTWDDNLNAATKNAIRDQIEAILGGTTPVLPGEIVKTSTDVLTVAEMTSSILSNFGQGAAMTLTLPTAAAGLNTIVTVFTTGNALHIKAGASDKIYFSGVALDDGDKVSNATPSAGDSLTVIAFKSGASTWDWMAFVGIGTWTDGGA